MGFLATLRHLLRGAQFRKLFAVRVTSQFADGFFQIGLASYVLFSPERQPDAASIAAALAVVLLPMTVIGPFAGVFLDRWNRRQTLAMANVVRVVPVLAAAAIIAADGPEAALLVAAIAAVSVNRFFLAGLSASLPRVVPREDLVMANAITPTSGTIAFMTGLGVASLVRNLIAPLPGDADSAIFVIASVIYLSAAGLALRIPRRQLGPDLDEVRTGLLSELHEVVNGLLAGIAHLRSRPTAAHALAVVGATRFLFALTTVATILLYRNYLNPPDDTDAGLAGLSIAVGVSGAGFLAAAVLTPIATQRMSQQRWMVVLLFLGAVVEVFPAGLFTEAGLLPAAFAIGLSAQGIKICVDTLVQLNIDDAYRGRVFSLYDVLFNLMFVAAAAVGALVVPDDGKSYALLLCIAAGYALTGLLYTMAERTRTATVTSTS